jgi:hypothetical protein
VEFESDCANLVQMTVGLGMDRSVILAVVMDIKDIMGRRSSTLVRKIWREQNRIAHNLANYALKSRSSRVSFSIVPLCIRDLVLNDRYHCRFRSILLNKDGFLLKKILIGYSLASLVSVRFPEGVKFLVGLKNPRLLPCQNTDERPGLGHSYRAMVPRCKSRI